MSDLTNANLIARLSNPTLREFNPEAAAALEQAGKELAEARAAEKTAYSRGYGDANREWQLAGDGKGF